MYVSIYKKPTVIFKKIIKLLIGASCGKKFF